MWTWLGIAMGICAMLFMGSCENDPCEGIVCENGGICQEGVCDCTTGFVGDDCGSIDVSRFIGTYAGRYEGCFQVSPSHEVLIGEGTTEGTDLEIINLGDFACPGAADNRSRVSASLSGTNLTIPSQTHCATTTFEGYTFSGSGTVFLDSIRIDFSVVYDKSGASQTDNCTAILIKR